MDVVTEKAAPAASHGRPGPFAWLLRLLDVVFGSRGKLRGWTLASLVMEMVIVVTGAVVRLTGSGLGCSTWPQCEPGSLTPHGAVTHHSWIEFGNRMLTFVVVVLAIGVLVSAWRSRADAHELKLAWYGVIAIPVEAVVGGIVVRSGLNPWLVGLHLMLSVWLVCLYTVLLMRVRDVPGSPSGPLVRGTATVLFGWMIITIWMGTLVTGAGPNSGSPGVGRNGLAILTMARAHAAFVWVALALTLGLFVMARRERRPLVVRWTLVLLATELLQGAIGYAQYFNGLPDWLVISHLAGMTLILVAATWLWFGVRIPRHVARRGA